jgi:hypothetical protein
MLAISAVLFGVILMAGLFLHRLRQRVKISEPATVLSFSDYYREAVDGLVVDNVTISDCARMPTGSRAVLETGRVRKDSVAGLIDFKPEYPPAAVIFSADERKTLPGVPETVTSDERFGRFR